jgi:hypothetical protein
MPRQEADALMRSIVKSVMPAWGIPTDTRAGDAKWEQSPFEAEIHVLCASECLANEPFQVWLTLAVDYNGMEKDEGDVWLAY